MCMCSFFFASIALHTILFRSFYPSCTLNKYFASGWTNNLLRSVVSCVVLVLVVVVFYFFRSRISFTHTHTSTVFWLQCDLKSLSPPNFRRGYWRFNASRFSCAHNFTSVPNCINSRTFYLTNFSLVWPKPNVALSFDALAFHHLIIIVLKFFAWFAPFEYTQSKFYHINGVSHNNYYCKRKTECSVFVLRIRSVNLSKTKSWSFVTRTDSDDSKKNGVDFS